MPLPLRSKGDASKRGVDAGGIAAWDPSLILPLQAEGRSTGTIPLSKQGEETGWRRRHFAKASRSG